MNNYVVNPYEFIHEEDARALNALKAIPGFDQLVKAFMKVFNEPSMKILNMSSKVRLSEEQCPRIYNLLIPICEKFGIPVPELYLELDRSPNAYTSGDTTIFITVTSGLLELMTDDEIQTILAHEVGHIVCHHVLYHTMGNIVLSGAAALLGVGPLITTAISTAFSYWMRCSEFSADRAAAVFCGGPDRVVDVMVRLASGSKDVAAEINKEVFMQQASEYLHYVNDSKWNKILEFFSLMDADHPFLAVRAASICEWYTAKALMEQNAASMNQLPAVSYCRNCGAPIGAGWMFCEKCGTPTN